MDTICTTRRWQITQSTQYCSPNLFGTRIYFGGSSWYSNSDGVNCQFHVVARIFIICSSQQVSIIWRRGYAGGWPVIYGDYLWIRDLSGDARRTSDIDMSFIYTGTAGKVIFRGYAVGGIDQSIALAWHKVRNFRSRVGLLCSVKAPKAATVSAS